MALSGSFTGTTSNPYITPKITWSATQTRTGNYSTITATLTYRRTNTGYKTAGRWSGSLTIGSETKTASGSRITITENADTVAITATVAIPHAVDGTLSTSISASGSIAGTTLQSTTISGSITLDKIPRATDISGLYPGPYYMPGGHVIEPPITIPLQAAVSSYTHKLEYNAGAGWVEIADDIASGTSYQWRLPNLATLTPNAERLEVTIRATTYNGSAVIGDSSARIIAAVPAEVRPSVTSVTFTEANPDLVGEFPADYFIVGKSQLRGVITAAGVSGSSIVKYDARFSWAAYNTQTFTTSAIEPGPANNYAVVFVTDSRGRTSGSPLPWRYNVEQYGAPDIELFTAERVTSGGVADPEGDRLRFVFSYKVHLQHKDASAVLEYRRSGVGSWTTLGTWTARTQTETTFTPSTVFSTDYTYEVRLRVSDWFGAETIAGAVIGTGETILDLKADGKGLAFGRVAEHTEIESAWSITAPGVTVGDLQLTDDTWGPRYNMEMHYQALTIEGSANSWYPLVIKEDGYKHAPAWVSVWRNLGETCASYPGNHTGTGTSSLWLLYEYRNTSGDGNGGFCRSTYHSEPYATLCAKAEADTTAGCGALIVWLRGGGTRYHVSTDGYAQLQLCMTRTNIGLESAPVYVEPVTTATAYGWAVCTRTGADLVIDSGTDANGWSWRRWASGVAECWGRPSFSTTIATAWGSIYSNASALTFSWPSGLFAEAPHQQLNVATVSPHATLGIMMEYGLATASTGGGFYVWRPTALTGTYNYTVDVYAVGKWRA